MLQQVKVLNTQSPKPDNLNPVQQWNDRTEPSDLYIQTTARASCTHTDIHHTHRQGEKLKRA